MPRTVTFPFANAASALANLAGTTATIVTPEPPVDPPPQPPSATWDGPGDPTLTVTVRAQQASNHAPSQVHFYIDVVGSEFNTPAAYDGTPTGFNAYDPQYHRVEPTLFTGDTGDYSNTDALPYAVWKTKAFQYGFVPKHVYSDPGLYPVRAYVYDQAGRWGVSPEITIPVTDPSTVFTAAGTIPVAPDGVFTGAPDHDASNRCTTMGQAVARVLALRASITNLRITLKPGSTALGGWVTGTGPSNWLRDWGGASGSGGQCLIDTWDFTGTRATVDLNSGEGTPGAGQNTLFLPISETQPVSIKWRGVDWIGTWDSVTASFKDTPASANWRRHKFFSGDGAGPMNRDHVVADCNFTGFWRTCFGYPSSAANASLNSVRFTMSNVRFMGCGDFAGFGMNGRFGAIAVSYEQPAGYANRGSGRNRIGPIQHGYQAHAFLREGNVSELYIRACYVQHSHGWPGRNEGALQFSVQPATRFGDGSTSPNANRRTWICDSVFHNSLSINGAAFRVNAVVENCFVNRAAIWSGQNNMRGAGAWSTVRNLHIWTPDIATGITTGNLSGRNGSWWPDGHTSLNTDFDSEGALDFGNAPETTGEVQLIHNTFVHLRTTANGSGGYRKYIIPGTAGFTIQEHGTLDYAPNINTPVVPSGGMTRFAAPVTMPNGHLRMPFEIREYVLPSAVAIGASTAEIPYGTDFYGNAVNAASFSGTSGRHSITLHVGGTASYSAGMIVTSAVDWQGDQAGNKQGAFIDVAAGISVAFNAGGFVLTNNSPREWPSGRMLTIYLDRGTSLMAADFHPSLVIPANTQGIYAPNQAIAPSGTRSCLFAIDRSFRPGGTKGNTSGTPFAGAVPVA